MTVINSWILEGIIEYHFIIPDIRELVFSLFNVQANPETGLPSLVIGAEF